MTTGKGGNDKVTKILRVNKCRIEDIVCNNHKTGLGEPKKHLKTRGKEYIYTRRRRLTDGNDKRSFLTRSRRVSSLDFYITGARRNRVLITSSYFQVKERGLVLSETLR